MKLSERSVVVVHPKQQFYDWLMGTPNPPRELSLQDLQSDCTVYLIPEVETLEDAWTCLEPYLVRIFQQELEAWSCEPAEWPASLDAGFFREWFDLAVHSLAFDLGGEGIYG